MSALHYTHRYLPANGVKGLPQIKNIVAIASGKGGVGKSTVAMHLAYALHRQGYKVGLLDADIYGPSQPLLLGTQNVRAAVGEDKLLEPVVVHGVQTMSIGYLIEANTPAIWRGPMVSGAIQQMLTGTRWNDLDYLLLDLPPGTGDVQLTLAQKFPVCGAVVVTTPQELSVLDVEKAIQMFTRVKVPLLGVIENMAHHICTNCGQHDAIFGVGGGKLLADKYESALLGMIPLSIALQTHQAMAQVDGVLAQVAVGLVQQLQKLPRDYNVPLTNVVIAEA